MIHSFGEVSGERTCLPLFIPLQDPFVGADSREALLEVLTWGMWTDGRWHTVDGLSLAYSR